jgi:oligopeptide transport system substrate-binding protein
MYRTLFGIFAAVALALVVVGLTFTAAAEERAEFVFVNGTEPKTLDPQKMTGQPEGRIADGIFEGLTTNDAKTLRPVPGAAESWETSPDGLRWTFRIREGARWSNGDPVTAHDFVYAWVRLQEPKIASEYAYLLHFVRHAEAYNSYAGHLTALRGDPEAEEEPARRGIVAGFADLLAEHPGGLPVANWLSFVEERGVLGATAKTREPALLDALARRDGRFTPEEGARIASALEAEAVRRAEALDQARARFGRDEGVYAPDDRTFVVELNAFTPYFLDLTAFYPTFPVHRPSVERWPENFFLPGKIVSNGPFLLEKWEVNRKIRLRRNPGYWGAAEVALETIDALPIENSTTAMNLYLTGEVDWAPSGYPPDLIDMVKVRDDYYSEPGMIVYYYRLNCTKDALKDPRVRRALGLAFDREDICREVLRAGQIPATTIVAPGVPGYESPASALGYDPAEARRLLADAGYPGGKGFPTISILFNTLEAHRKIAERIAHQWKENLGIAVNPRNEEWQSYQESTRRLTYEVARAAWIGDYRDPNTFLDMWITDGGNNQTGWGNALYDRLIALAGDPLALVALPPAQREDLLARFSERGRAEERLAAVEAAADASARVSAAAALRLHLFREAEAILFQQEFPILPIYFYVVTGLKSPRVEGFYTKVEEDGRLIPNLQDIHPLREIRMRPVAGGAR